MALLSDQASVLSTNNSDSFLQKLAHIDQRERINRHEQERKELDTGTPMSNQTKAEEIVLLEKQGICSQKLRNNLTGNLAQVTHTIGQNMTDISNIGGNNSKKDVKSFSRGTSLPPSALPRPPRLKPPRKIDYDRLSDSELKARSQTPPKLSQSSAFDMKMAALKRGEYSRRDYVLPAKNYVDMMNFPNPHFSLKRKDYGSMTKAEFSKPEHTSTKYYHRLEESPKSTKISENGGFKRSLLPARKYSPAPSNSNKQNSRDSLNSSESNHSANSHLHVNSRTPPKYMSLTPQTKTASLPPKPVDSRMARRGSSVTKGENRYKIQF